jgi:hypothetical protein
MIDRQPEALRLADAIDEHRFDFIGPSLAATELRRLHEVNQELIKTLKFFAKAEINDSNCASLEVAQNRVRAFAADAIAKAEVTK